MAQDNQNGDVMGTEASTRDRAVVQAITDKLTAHRGVSHSEDVGLAKRDAEIAYDAAKEAGMVTRDHLTAVRRQQARCIEEKDRLRSSIQYALEHLRPDTVRGVLAAQAVEHLREVASTG